MPRDQQESSNERNRPNENLQFDDISESEYQRDKKGSKKGWFGKALDSWRYGWQEPKIVGRDARNRLGLSVQKRR